jgi:hypothetical protein
MNRQPIAPVPRLAFVGACLLCAVGQAGAAVYWQAGVRAEVITICFVGDALMTRPDRIQEIASYLTDYEYSANIRFSYLGQCPVGTSQPSGNDYYDGDIRVVLPGTSAAFTGMVPGRGCPMFLDDQGNYNGGNDGGGSWSNAPSDLSNNRACLYNLKLNDDADGRGVPWRNHALHEFGHALGLAHEHDRRDVDKSVCARSGYGGGISSGFLTLYDRYSVMHYQFADCGINGNYDHPGLSTLDRVGMHILYPEAGFVAEYVGTTVVQSTQPVHLPVRVEITRR